MLVQLGWVPWRSCPGRWDMLHPMQTSVLPLASLAMSPTPGCHVDPSTPTPLPWRRGASPNAWVPAGPWRSPVTITMSDSSHPAQPSALAPSSPQCAGDGAQPSAEGASTLDCNAPAPGGEAGALCDRDLWNESWGAAGPVGPPEMGLSHIFPGATQKDRWPAADKLMLGGLASAGRSLPLLQRDGMGQGKLQLSSPEMGWPTAALSPVQR